MLTPSLVCGGMQVGSSHLLYWVVSEPRPGVGVLRRRQRQRQSAGQWLLRSVLSCGEVTVLDSLCVKPRGGLPVCFCFAPKWYLKPSSPYVILYSPYLNLLGNSALCFRTTGVFPRATFRLLPSSSSAWCLRGSCS